MENVEREIDLIDFIESICKKWRMLLLFLILGLIIGTAAATFKGVQKKEEASAGLAIIEKTLDEIEEELGKEENAAELKRVADNNILTYKVKEKQYDMQETYMEESVYFNIDERAVSKIKLSYNIDNNFSVMYPEVNSYNKIGDITQYFAGRLTSNKLYDKVINQVYPDSEYRYIRELISVGNASTGNLNVDIRSDSKENAERIASIIKSEIKTIAADAEKTYGTVDCVLQTEQYTVETDVDVANAHAAEVQKLVDLETAMANIKNSMTGAQLEYFKAKLDMEEAGEPSESIEIQPLSYYISKKVIVIGGVVGMFLIAGIFACAYIFSGSIKTPGDISLLVQAINFGSITPDAVYTNPVDRLISKIFHGRKIAAPLEKRVDIAAGMIAESMNTHKLKKLCIVSSADLSGAAGLEQLVKAISDRGIGVSVADSFLVKPDVLKETNDADSIIVMEVLNCSSYEDLSQELRLLRINNANILGCMSA